MQKSINTLLEPGLGFTDVSRDFTKRAPTPTFFKNKIVLENVNSLLENLKELSSFGINLMEYEKKFIVTLGELLKDNNKYLNIANARNLLALSMEAIIDRAELIKNTLLLQSKDSETYDGEFMKVIFVIEANKNIVIQTKELLISNLIRTNDLNNYLSALSNIFWCYQFLKGEKEVDINSIMQLTSEIKQKELRKSYYVKFN